ncbi:hypothetical protein [Mesorhizobium sp. Pch-S]|uniref:hypothetical protein n=1 Tax=Mesorhizobium sp. Pch-S TaxID=2082387 RepID=UPI0010131965|nr:hypothetical protein [Mesorhizobium sp. Pch-S]
MWIRFTEDFDFSPAALGGRVTTAFKAGMVENVTRECSEAAIAANRAVPASRPRTKDDQDGNAGEQQQPA